MNTGHVSFPSRNMQVVSGCFEIIMNMRNRAKHFFFTKLCSFFMCHVFFHEVLWWYVFFNHDTITKNYLHENRNGKKGVIIVLNFFTAEFLSSKSTTAKFSNDEMLKKEENKVVKKLFRLSHDRKK